MGATREQIIEAKAEAIAAQAGLGSRILIALLEQAVRAGFDIAVDEIAGSN